MFASPPSHLQAFILPATGACFVVGCVKTGQSVANLITGHFLDRPIT